MAYIGFVNKHTLLQCFLWLLMSLFQSKCDQYWPSEGTEEFGDIELRLEREDTLAFYTLRTFSLRSKITVTHGKKTKVGLSS